MRRRSLITIIALLSASIGFGAAKALATGNLWWVIIPVLSVMIGYGIGYGFMWLVYGHRDG